MVGADRKLFFFIDSFFIVACNVSQHVAKNPQPEQPTHETQKKDIPNSNSTNQKNTEAQSDSTKKPHQVEKKDTSVIKIKPALTSKDIINVTLLS